MDDKHDLEHCNNHIITFHKMKRRVANSTGQWPSSTLCDCLGGGINANERMLRRDFPAFSSREFGLVRFRFLTWPEWKHTSRRSWDQINVLDALDIMLA